MQIKKFFFTFNLIIFTNGNVIVCHIFEYVSLFDFKFFKFNIIFNEYGIV